MKTPDWESPLRAAYDAALRYLTSLPERPVGARVGVEDLRRRLDQPLPAQPLDPAEVIRALAAAADDGLVASGSGRFYGFVFGGATPAAIAADWLTSVWDQNAGLYAASPAAAVTEEVVGRWVLELLGLPTSCSVGFVTGAQMATVTCLAAARHEVLRRRGHDVEAAGLAGAPPITVLVGAQRHTTIDRAVRLLGLGTGNLVFVDVDSEGRLVPAALAAALSTVEGPAIVCAQVGNVDSGAIDPMSSVCAIAHAAGAWVHVDGAFGLWAAASPALRPLLSGVEEADSWTTDAHKWLNVPYDSGIAICRHPSPHRAAMGVRASYLVHAESGERDAFEFGPDFSRRARGFPIYAALLSLGSAGVAALVERCCELARRFADQLTGEPGVSVLNEVVLNQVLVSFAGVDAYDLAQRARAEGTCFVTATAWEGTPALRFSVTNWTTEASDIDRTAATLLALARP